MVLKTARPTLRQGSKNYFLRKRVPDDLRSLIGKLEIKISLRTTDPGIAKAIHAVWLSRIECEFTRLRSGGPYSSSFWDFDATELQRNPIWRPSGVHSVAVIPSISPRAINEPGKDFSPLAVFDEYAKEAKISAGTRKRWEPIIAGVQSEVPDIRDITPAWCVAWKKRLLKSALNPGTIQNVYFGALRTVCNFAVGNLILASNPLDKIRVRVPKAERLRRTKGYTWEEAKIVLSASLVPVTNNNMPQDRKDGRRWLPWLGYYTGGRIGELAQLRKPDVFEEQGVWVIRITPEAGTIKTGEVRLVAIHPHLIEQGFLKFVEELERETLFYDPGRARGGSASNPIAKKTGERLCAWIRSLGLTDKELKPNHAWRHRFKTMGRLFNMNDLVRDHMLGHAPANVGESYGDFPAAVLFREIIKIPRFNFDRPDVTLADLELDAGSMTD